ncbi:MAG: ABC transporter permease [Gemmatimonas sp.]
MTACLPMNLRTILVSTSRTRLTSAAVIAFVAVGTAALTTAFGLADAALWRPPPLEDIERVVMLLSTHKTPNAPERTSRWSYARVQELRRQTTDFEAVANVTGTSLTFTSNDASEFVPGEFVSSHYARVLGVRTAAGRWFTAVEDSAVGAHAVAVVSHEFWMQRLGGRADVVGSTIRFNSQLMTVIGIASPGFRGVSGAAQFWLPATMAPTLTYPEYLTTDQDFIGVVAKLKPGVDIERARAAMQRVGPEIYAASPIHRPDVGLVSGATLASIQELRVTPEIRRSVLLLLGAVGVLHLLACANVASLLLGKAAARRREVAIRQALGATLRKLLPEVLAESIVLVVVGGALGALIAFWTSAFIPPADQLWATSINNGAVGAFSTPSFGPRTVLFVLGTTVVSALLVCWAPAAGLLRLDMSGSLRDGARGYTMGGATLRKPNARGIIVAIEAALAIVLLMAGNLMIDSFARMRNTSLGIDASHVLSFDFRVTDARVPPDEAPAYITRMLDRLTAIPGVVSATVDGGAPVSGSASSTLIIAGRPEVAPDLAPPVLRHYVAPDHFITLGIPLIAGRTFTANDREGSPRVVIISELAAKRFWPGQNPIGQRVWFGGGSSFNSAERSGEIVGIVGDVAYQPLDREPFRPDFYTPYMQFTYASRIVFLRTTGDPLAMTGAVRRAMNDFAPDIALRDVQSMESLIGKSWMRQRFDALLFASFGMLAMLLSASGIYAVVAYAINQRTREMGVRLALGASNGAVVSLVVREGMMFPLAGLTVGVVLALALGQVLAASLYQVSPTDPMLLLQTIAVLVGGSLLACLVPALRATRVDPLTAMRAGG